ncbi:MAG: 16S rRNA (cytosine(1402)-N(4))-methyltransferase RsmH [Chloroflexi bacterium]|nr:16S rRNA (cytosine(1402)-N(4))-methyltransferase RsmH [Chloroflexota bacterium]
MPSDAQHLPVLYESALALLEVCAGGWYIDATCGLGGHSHGILERSAPGGRLLMIDRDPQALAIAEERLAGYANRFESHCGSFSDMAVVAEESGYNQVDGILFDLGVSSLQLDEPQRGFSFLHDGPLDMRMNPTTGASAADLVNHAEESALADLIYLYGEERRARRVARAIVAARPLRSTAQLAEVVDRAVGFSGKIHPATRTFQALRIATNSELDELQRALPQTLRLLKPGGVLAVISFHSLEDRIVKQFMQRESQDCICPPELPVCRCDHHAMLTRLTRKPVIADEAEVAANPRARSAKLRAARRTEAAA